MNKADQPGRGTIMGIVSIQIILAAAILAYIQIIRAKVREIHEDNVAFQRDRDVLRQERIRQEIAGLHERVTRLERWAGRF